LKLKAGVLCATRVRACGIRGLRKSDRAPELLSGVPELKADEIEIGAVADSP
jgi:hypothetical protein